MSVEREIFEALETKLQELSWAKTVDYEKIRVTPTDIQDDELPRIQIYDNTMIVAHERTQLRKTWSIVVELILKTTRAEEVNQGVLLDRKVEIERKVGESPNLGVAGMIHMAYVRADTDLHSIQPYYLARLEFSAIFRTPYSGDC